jgi:hypothetical protein
MPGTRKDIIREKELALMLALSGTSTRTPGNLVAEGKLPEDSSLPGIHQTAASLVRKGYLNRETIGGKVHYSLTREGRSQLRELQQQAARDAAVFVRSIRR